MINYIAKMFEALLKLTIRVYMLVISPLLSSRCRFEPSCSKYALESLDRFGLFKGIYLSTKRLLKCHPLKRLNAIYDPVPEKVKHQLK